MVSFQCQKSIFGPDVCNINHLFTGIRSFLEFRGSFCDTHLSQEYLELSIRRFPRNVMTPGGKRKNEMETDDDIAVLYFGKIYFQIILQKLLWLVN